jgi:hypothetical protein
MENDPCNFLSTTVAEASESKPVHVQLINKIPVLMSTAYARIKYNFLKMSTPKATEAVDHKPLNLQPGDLVEVLSMREISLTLDHKGRNKGLYFMPEMERFCGKRFKVFKKVVTIRLEDTGELRKLRIPSVFLEGVYCDGKFQGNCDRACFHFWREEWLKRVINGS